MPPDEPFASCAFAWPEGWSVTAHSWTPPSALATAPLFDLSRGDAVLQVFVARFGVEVDGFAFLTQWQKGVELRRWHGLPVALGAAGDAEHWAVVHVGPAVFFARATGAARTHLEHATQSWRTLSGQGPAAEALMSYVVGDFCTRRLVSWSAESAPKSRRHGELVGRLVSRSPKGELVAALQIRTVDRRVYVGLNPAGVQARLDHDWHLLGFERDSIRGDPGPAGVAELSIGRLNGVPAELRRGFARIGPTWVFVDGLWAHDSAIARLNGRRHFDLVLCLAEGTAPPG